MRGICHSTLRRCRTLPRAASKMSEGSATLRASTGWGPLDARPVLLRQRRGGRSLTKGRTRSQMPCGSTTAERGSETDRGWIEQRGLDGFVRIRGSGRSGGKKRRLIYPWHYLRTGRERRRHAWLDPALRQRRGRIRRRHRPPSPIAPLGLEPPWRYCSRKLFRDGGFGVGKEE